MSMNRREFLVLAGASTLAWPSLSVLATEIAAPKTAADLSPQQWLNKLLPGSAKAAADIGQVWKQRFSAETLPSSAQLQTQLSTRLSARGWQANLPDAAWREHWQALLQEEFVQHQLIDIDGWQMARSNAELCLLASLIQPA